MATAAAALLILTASATRPWRCNVPAPAGDALAYIDVYNGRPESQADLAPNDTKMTGGMTSNFWHWRARPDGLSIKCGYGRGPGRPHGNTGCRIWSKPVGSIFQTQP